MLAMDCALAPACVQKLGGMISVTALSGLKGLLH
jgi:hypothetical protein